MAKTNDKAKAKSKKTSLRQSIDESANKSPKKRRLRKQAQNVKSPVKKLANKTKKEYHLPLPGNKPDKFLGKKRSFIPRYFKESWQELKLVTWPDRRTTIRLTIAVLIFAVVFGLAIAIVDFGLDKIFRKLILE